MNSMKKFLVLSVMASGTCMVQAMNVQGLNLSEIGNKAKDFVGRINFNQSPEEVAEQVKQIAGQYVDQLPADVLGVNIHDLRAQYVTPEMAQKIKSNLPAALKTLRKVNTLLMNPAAMIDLFNMAYNLGEEQLAQYTDVSAAAKEAVQFMSAHKESIVPVAKALSSYVKQINDAFDGVDIKTMSVQDIANKFKTIVDISVLEKEAAAIYPKIAQLVNQYSDDLQKLFEQVKKIKMTQVQEALSRVQEELKKLQ